MQNSFKYYPWEVKYGEPFVEKSFLYTFNLKGTHSDKLYFQTVNIFSWGKNFNYIYHSLITIRHSNFQTMATKLLAAGKLGIHASLSNLFRVDSTSHQVR